jgi:ABC-type amino acid transport substrate-binding protein
VKVGRLAGIAMAMVGVLGGVGVNARTLNEIKASGELRIGDEASYIPFAFRKDGHIVGYDIDVADRICTDLRSSAWWSALSGPASFRRCLPTSST